MDGSSLPIRLPDIRGRACQSVVFGGATDPTLASAATGAWSGAERHGVRRRSGAELPLSDGCVGVAGG